jgi:hypothetical protein
MELDLKCLFWLHVTWYALLYSLAETPQPPPPHPPPWDSYTMSPRNNSTKELISHKESIPWNRCLGSLKVYKFGLSTLFCFCLHCYKTFRRIPPPSPDDAGLILLGRGKRLLYMGREFAPSGTEVFCNHRKFLAIFTMKKGRTRTVGSNSVPPDYYSCPLPLDHGYHVSNVKKYTLINIKYQRESIKSNI